MNILTLQENQVKETKDEMKSIVHQIKDICNSLESKIDISTTETSHLISPSGYIQERGPRLDCLCTKLYEQRNFLRALRELSEEK